MSAIKINVLDPLVFIFPKENTLPMNIPTTVDYSAKAVTFAVKADENNTTPEIITKKNTLNGGSDSQVLVTSTNIQVNILYTDTANMASQKWYWEVKDIADEYRIAWGYIFLQPTIISYLDPPYTPPVPPAGSQLIFSVISNILTKEYDSYGTALVLTKLATGTYEIVSSQAIFTDLDRVESSLIMRADSDYYFFMFNKVSSYELIITITSLMAGGTQDHDFRISMFRASI